jgi:hypothetical protein
MRISAASKSRWANQQKLGEVKRDRLLLTGEIPWLALVEVDVSDDEAGEEAVEHLGDEVVGHHLLVGGVEPEPRRQLQLLLLVVDRRHDL